MTDEAIRRIEHCHRTKETALDLDLCEITDLSVIAHLTHLISLNLSSNQISDYTALSALRDLTKLKLWNNELSDLTPLSALTNLTSLVISGNGVSDLTPLSALVNLTSLVISGNELSNLSPLSVLVNLTSLDITDNVVSNLSPLSVLVNLTSLVIRGNEVSDLTALSALVNLTSLDITGNEASDLTPLSVLVNLTSLDIKDNPISDLTALSSLGNLTSLVIHNNEISDLTPLSALGNLTSLDISQNQLSDLTALSALVNLTSLVIHKNEVSDLTALSALVNLTSLDISQNQISDLTPLSSLISLTSLVIRRNQISDLTPLSFLDNLTSLSVGDNQISNLLPLSPLVNLTRLAIGKNQISDLTPLSTLVNLKELYVWSNKISNLVPLSSLIRLTYVNIYENQISTLKPILPLIKKGIPVMWENRRSSNGIILEHNTLDTSLIAAIKQGNQAVIDYYEQLDKQGGEYLFEAKLMIVGEPRAGKTTLRLKLKDINAALPPKEDSTKGVFIEQERVVFTTLDPLSKEPAPFHYTIWDFGGQDVYKPISQLFVTRSALYVAVINTDLNENDKDLMYWFETLEKLSGSSLVLVLENTPTDRKQTKNLSSIRTRFAAMWRNLHIVNMDKLIADSDNFDKKHLRIFELLRGDIHRNLEALPHRQDRVPKSWAAIRRGITDKAMEKQPNGTLKPTMTYTEFEDLCTLNGITAADAQARLCETLHILGVFLHYKDNEVLSDLIILNNKWATDAAYVVLDDATVKRKDGRFDKADIPKIWTDEAYKGQRKLLTALMQEFRLCYNIRDTTTYIVPHCLPLYDSHAADWDTTDNVRLIVQYDYLPLATVVQLLVGLHEYIAKGQTWIWQKGGVIEGNLCNAYDTFAHIEQYDDAKRLYIRVRGKATQQMMTVVLNELDKVNKPYPTLEIKKLIACNCADCLNAKEPTYFDFRKELLRHLFEKNKRDIYCTNLADFVPIDQLLRGVISKEQIVRDAQTKDGRMIQHITNYNIQGDNIGGDKAAGDKVVGNKHER